jgi:DNA-binding CsgD family transcriptional regulator
MYSFSAPLPPIMEILSKAPGNPGLWHLFLAELVSTMQCDSGFLSIADLDCNGGIHYLCQYNVETEQLSHFELNYHKAGSFAANVTKTPYHVFHSKMQYGTICDGVEDIESEATEEYYRFGVSIPLNSRYAYCIYLNSRRPAAEPVLQGCVHWLQALIAPLQNALHKEQWFSLYNQITLLTGKHVAAYLIVDRALNVLFSDAIFNHIIEDMECVEIRGKQLAFLNKTTEEWVLAFMDGEGCETVTRQNQCASYDITVIPARALDNLYAWEFYRQGTVLTFTSGHKNNLTLVRMMALYNLTQGEALIALQFINTPSISEIASASHRSPETVRNHIKSIMRKLDVHNQGALMKKLLAIVAL